MPRVAVSTCRRHPRRRTSLPTKTVRSSLSDRQTRGSTSPELSAHSLTLSSHWSFRHSLHDSRRCRGNGIVRLDERTRRDRKSIVEGKRVSYSVDIGGRQINKKKKENKKQSTN